MKVKFENTNNLLEEMGLSDISWTKNMATEWIKKEGQISQGDKETVVETIEELRKWLENQVP